MHFRTGWISDVHLGTRGSQAAALLDFLRSHEFETLYIVGDLIDVWSLKRGIYWPQLHNDVIQKILRAARKGTRVVYVPGNHDEFVSAFHGEYGAVTVVPRAIHTTQDGRRLLVIHGHELDTVVQNSKWLAHVGDVGYCLLLRLNTPINWIRRKMGLHYWSLSAAAKRQVKNAVNYIGAFEEAVVRLAKLEPDIDGVVCGHIHTPAIRKIGELEYFNSGDWVESLSALVEDSEGRLQILNHVPRENGVPALPVPALLRA
jgi:UDP-2,3-diacylglucosamine pyrophosphatase LpxH